MKELFNSWKEVTFNPLEFYQKLPKKTKYRGPSLFYLKINALTLGLMYLLLLIIGAFFILFMGALGGPLGIIGGGFGLVALVIAVLLYPLFLLLSWGLLFAGAGITHLFVLMFGGKQGYAETFKVQAYAVAPVIFSVIPYIGYAATIYTLVLEVIGIHHRQKLSWGKSVAVIILPIVILTVLVIGIMYAIFASLLTTSMVTGLPGGLS